VRLIRFADNAGRILYGVAESERRARVIRGDVFGEFEVSSESVEIRKLLAPVQPPNIYAMGLNYRSHAREGGAESPPEAPVIFLKATTALIGPGEPIVLPPSAPDEVDYEAELAVVIGRRARDVAPEEALEYVLGYTCANDVSARDCQMRIDKQWARAKSFDTFCPLGPAIETGIDPGRLGVRLRLNGRIMQEANTSELVWDAGRLVSHLSRQFTLPAGTVILTGTPAGVGCFRKPPVFLRPGDTVEVEIDGIGALSNPVAGPGG